MNLMIVEWVDAVSDAADWTSLKEMLRDEPIKCRSVGWVVAETDKFLHLVPNIGVDKDDPEDLRCMQGFGGIVILKDNIISTQEVI